MPVLQVGRLDAVDDEAVLASARAVDRDAAELGLLVGAGRLRDQRREVAALGQLLDLLGRDAGLARALLGVDDGRFGRDRHGLGDAADASARSIVRIWPRRSSIVLGLAPA